MKIKKIVFLGLFYGASALAEIFPMVQSHSFQMEPYLKNTQGYAFFIYSSAFTGNELVTVLAPDGSVLPDIKTASRVLNQYSSGQWYISDSDRVASATSGALSEGFYVASVRGPEGNTTLVPFNYKADFLLPATNIQLQTSDPSLQITWSADPRANTFWVFAFAMDTKNILDDLKQVSSVMHAESFHSFKKNILSPGTYKIAIRSNRLWEGGTFWGFDSEAWSISHDSFTVP